MIRRNSFFGEVEILWTLQHNRTKNFFQNTEGVLNFKQNEISRFIKLLVNEIFEPIIQFTFSLELVKTRNPYNNSRFGCINVEKKYIKLKIENYNHPFGLFSFSSNTLAVEEGNKSTNLKIIRTKGSYGRATVTLELLNNSNAIENTDFILQKKYFFKENEKIKNVNLEIVDDSLPEIAECTFTFS